MKTQIKLWRGKSIEVMITKWKIVKIEQSGWREEQRNQVDARYQNGREKGRSIAVECFTQPSG